MLGFGCLRRQQLISRLSRQFRKGLVLLQSNGQCKAQLTRPHERPVTASYTTAAGRAGPTAMAAAAAAAAGKGSNRAAPLKARAAAVPNSALAPRPRSQTAEDAFYAEQASSFADLGIVPAVAGALTAAGFTKPSRVQELALPQIVSGKDMVLAAETGSGKTLAYIAPIASHLVKAKEAAAAAAAAAKETTTTATDRRWRQQMALVLCPNVALCQQVVRLVGLLQQPSSSSSSSSGGGGGSQPLLRACHISTSNPPPFEQPDIIVTTPGALVTLFNDRGYSYGSRWTAEGISSRTAFVVVDEADLLSQGGYIKDLHRLLDAFKAGERREIEAQVMRELDITEERFSSLPRHLKQACWEAGAAGLIKAGFSPAGKQKQQQEGQQQQAAVELDASTTAAEQAAPAQDNGLASSSLPSTSSSCTSSGGVTTSSSSSTAGGPYGPYFKRQYLFVAATMPALTKADVGTALQKRFQNAVWVSGDLLHQVKPHVDHTWVHVTPESADSALINTIKQDPDYQSGRARVLVFARESAGADRVSSVLAEAGIANVLYHKNVPKEQRDAALAAMAGEATSTPPNSRGTTSSSSSSNAVMVSTDAAARGIDLPDITHVIQADFSQTAIEFLHRVGRTARAGKDGKVTSLFGDSDAVLVGALRQYINEGKPIEDCFSRNRSFSKKVRRYGKFVPRGQRA